jgi:hypothetical protein
VQQVTPLKIWVVLMLLCPGLFAQDSFVRNQAWCAKKAEANMKATRERLPDVAATILSYLYEYSPHHHACVAIIEYKVQKDGKPYAQILARNMITLQPMKGFAEIYLEPMEDSQARIDAINSLFDEYSR